MFGSFDGNKSLTYVNRDAMKGVYKAVLPFWFWTFGLVVFTLIQVILSQDVLFE
jgi:hypothetical protein